MMPENRTELLSLVPKQCMLDPNLYVLKSIDTQYGSYRNTDPRGMVHIAKWYDQMTNTTIVISYFESGDIVKEIFDDNCSRITTEHYIDKGLPGIKFDTSELRGLSKTFLETNPYVQNNSNNNGGWFAQAKNTATYQISVHTDEEYEILSTELSIANNKNEQYLDIIQQQADKIRDLNEKVSSLIKIVEEKLKSDFDVLLNEYTSLSDEVITND